VCSRRKSPTRWDVEHRVGINEALADVTAFFRALDVDPNAMFDGPIW